MTAHVRLRYGGNYEVDELPDWITDQIVEIESSDMKDAWLLLTSSRDSWDTRVWLRVSDIVAVVGPAPGRVP